MPTKTLAIELRPYQQEAQKVCLAALKKEHTAILQSPVGSGKTVMAMAIAAAAKQNTLIISHRRELNEQLAKAAELFGVKYKALTVQALNVPRSGGMSGALAQFGMVIIDEAHRSAATTYQKLMASAAPKTLFLGLTATPVRLDGLPLLKEQGGHFAKLVVAAETSEMVAKGYILAPRVFSCNQPLDTRDMTPSYRSRNRDYRQDELSEAAKNKYFNGEIIANWQAKARGKSTLVFAVNREHGKLVARKFAAAGVSVAYLDGETSKTKRSEILRDFRRRVFTVLVNVEICAEGWDWPELECVVLATATRSSVLYRQMCGRVMRNHLGKKTPIILDHGCNVFTHGLPSNDETPIVDGKRGGGSELLKACPECASVVAMGTKACECGHDFTKDRAVKLGYSELPVELIEVSDLAHKYGIKVDPHECWLPAGGAGVKFEARGVSLRRHIAEQMGLNCEGTGPLFMFCRSKLACVNPEHLNGVRSYAETMPRLFSHWTQRNKATGCLEWMRHKIACNDAVACGKIEKRSKHGNRDTRVSPVSFMRDTHPDVAVFKVAHCNNPRCVEPTHFGDKSSHLMAVIRRNSKRVGECDVWTGKSEKQVSTSRLTLQITLDGKTVALNPKHEILRMCGFAVQTGARIRQTCNNSLCVRGSHLQVQAPTGKWVAGDDL